MSECDYHNKLSGLTSVPTDCIKKFSDYIGLIHGNDLFVEMNNSNEDVYDIEIFEGHIYIKVDNNDVKYKFIPNTYFNEIILNTIKSEESPLIKALNAKVVKAMTNVYKELT